MSRILTLLSVLCLLARPACAQEAGAQADSIAHLINTYQERADSAAHADNYPLAITLIDRAFPLIETAVGKAFDYACFLKIKAQFCYENHDLKNAIKCGTEAADMLAAEVGGDSLKRAEVLNDLAVYYAENKRFIKAIQLDKEALDIQRKLLGDVHPTVSSTLLTLAVFHAQREEYAEAIKYAKESLDINIRTTKLETPDNSGLLSTLETWSTYIKDIKGAIRYASANLMVLEKLAGTENDYYLATMENLANYYAYLYDYEKAIQLENTVAETRKKLHGTENAEYATSLYNLASWHNKNGNPEKAYELVLQTLDIRGRVLGKEHPDYVTALNNLAVYCAGMGAMQKADSVGTEALRLREKIFGKDNDTYALSLSNLASYKWQNGNYEQGKQLTEEALLIRERTVGKKHTDYAASLSNLAFLNNHLHNYREAIEQDSTAAAIYLENEGERSLPRAQALTGMAKSYSALGEHGKALGLLSEALTVYQDIWGKKHPQSAALLNTLAQEQQAAGNYQEAARLAAQVKDICEKDAGEEAPLYVDILKDLARTYYLMGNYAEAFRLGRKAATFYLQYTTRKDWYADMLGDLSVYESAAGNYGEAIRLGTETLRIRETLLGKAHPNIISTLSNLASFHAEVGDYEKAIRYGTEVLERQKNVYGEEYPENALYLNNLAEYYGCLENYQKAIGLSWEALNLLEKAGETESKKYADALYSLSHHYYRTGQYGPVIKAATECARIIEKLYGKNHPEYAEALNMLGFFAELQGKKEEAVRMYQEAMKIQADCRGKLHPDYLTVLNNLTVCYWSAHDPAVTASCIDMTELLTQCLTRSFSDLTKTERTQFWLMNRYWFASNIHQIAYTFPSDSLTANAYNGLLLSKGLLLNSEIELSTLLAESGDAEVETLYNDLRNLRLQLNRLYEQPVAERALSTDSLEQEAQRLERALVQRSKVYGDFTRNLAIDWQQVQQRLGERDVAVEFTSFATGQDSVMYAAYCLRRGERTPRMVPLFEEKQLKAVGATHYYDRPDVARLVWQPLAKELEGADRVYFAPDGELYNIAIESVPHWADSLLVSDHYRFYRLSSTRQLALTRDEQSADEAALYGGLRYDTDVTTLVNDSRRRPATTRAADFALLHLADSLNLRAGLQDLPATLTEAEEIETHLRNAGTHATLYTDTAGTEASFKALSGRRTRLMHIATHGFYWTEREAQAIGDRLAFLNTAGQTARYVEDKALTRSGLFFAGVNHALEGEPLPADVDDGILTAREISILDLRGLDLVVLSACQTGLGEITGDGVFGLQRGFKKAGAGTLLMSLWKVDDQATQLLMTRFYANLTAGQSKAESLREAQRYVREYEVEQAVTPQGGRRPLSAHARQQAQQQQTAAAETRRVRPYHSPRFWAAFILLDALD